MAKLVGVTVGTVSHAYRTLRQQGLVRGEVGRGTYVRYSGPESFEFVQTPSTPLRANLRHNYPVAVSLEKSAIATTLDILSQRGAIDATVDSIWAVHEPRYSRAGAAWLDRIGAKATPDCVHVHPGAHTALMTALLATTKPGDVVLAPELCYPGWHALADRLALQVQPVRTDDEGMLPHALDKACAKYSPSTIYCAPTVDTVTTATASSDRRRALGEIVRKRGVWLCEFEDTSFLMPRPPRPIQSFAPERVLLVGDTTRALSLGMRTSYLLAPEQLNARVRESFNATLWQPIPLLAEVVTQWIEDGTADRLLTARRNELATRHRIVKRIFRGTSVRSHRTGHHLWLQLPRGMQSGEFVMAAERAGVGITGADEFARTGTTAPEAVRVCYGAARSRADLEWALLTLSELLTKRPN